LAAGLAILLLAGRIRIPFLSGTRTAPKPNPVKRWMDQIQAKRRQKQVTEQRLTSEELDQILDKIAKSGMNSLSKQERKKLESTSRDLRK